MSPYVFNLNTPQKSILARLVEERIPVVMAHDGIHIALSVGSVLALTPRGEGFEAKLPFPSSDNQLVSQVTSFDDVIKLEYTSWTAGYTSARINQRRTPDLLPHWGTLLAKLGYVKCSYKPAVSVSL